MGIMARGKSVEDGLDGDSEEGCAFNVVKDCDIGNVVKYTTLMCDEGLENCFYDCDDVFKGYSGDIVKYTSDYISQLPVKANPPIPPSYASRRQDSLHGGDLRQNGAPEKDMTVLVFNCGLLRWRGAVRGNWFENPPLANERFAHLPDALLDSNADLIALTEIYEDGHVEALLEKLKEAYPYHARGDVRTAVQRRYKFHNGLLILSKSPIEEEKIVQHRDAAPIEKMLGSKCMLAIKLVHKDLGRLCIVNMHTTAGGYHPEASDLQRQSELQEALAECDAAMAMGYKAIILGDLNMGPEASANNYNFLYENGYVDAVAECIGDDRLKAIFTWDPANPLNAMGPHKASPPQRCDHLFVHRSAGIEASRARVTFSEAGIDTRGGKCTLSDHYGILTSLRLRQEQQAKCAMIDTPSEAARSPLGVKNAAPRCGSCARTKRYIAGSWTKSAAGEAHASPKAKAFPGRGRRKLSGSWKVSGSKRSKVKTPSFG